MVKCDKCGKEEDLPFRCNYCGGYFCSEHRLPEFHDCTGLYKQRRSVNIGQTAGERVRDYSYRATGRGVHLSSLFKFSDREIKDLGISLLIISALSLQLMLQYGLLFSYPLIALGSVLIFGAAFLLHEIAHKLAAQRYGYWAEFRINQTGLMITLLSFISPFKLVAPGAVMIAGLMYGDDYGKISLAGPLTNIVQAVIYSAISLLSGDPHIRFLGMIGASINSSLALFNLIPFGVFDGLKIMRWNWKVWLATTAVTVILYFYSSV